MSASDIGNIINKSERAVKFQSARLMVEILEGRRLTVKEQKKLYNRVASWHPERSKTYVCERAQQKIQVLKA